MDAVTLGVEKRLERRADLAGPLDRSLEPLSLKVPQVHGLIVHRVDPRNKLGRTFCVTAEDAGFQPAA